MKPETEFRLLVSVPASLVAGWNLGGAGAPWWTCVLAGAGIAALAAILAGLLFGDRKT